jgi:hypothetical protein
VKTSSTTLATIIKVGSVTVLTGTVFLTSVDFKNINPIIASTNNNVDSSSALKNNQFPTIAQKIKNTSVLFVQPEIQVSFAGQPAQAQRAKIIKEIWVKGKKVVIWAEKVLTWGSLVEFATKLANGTKADKVYFAVTNDVPMEWGEAWYYCNKYPNATLTWNNGLKTCVPR